MGTLASVSSKNDSFLVTYPSEPILAFGATKVWYGDKGAALHAHILPEFESLLHQSLLDIGEIGEVVARLILLLAMDKAILLEHGGNHPIDKFNCCGQETAVGTFLNILSDDTDYSINSQIRSDKKRGGLKRSTEKANETSDNQRSHVKQQKQIHAGLKVKFSHFVPLEMEPTTEVLWYMLSQNAAGVLPSGHDGADFIIPVHNGQNVLYIAVQVKSVLRGDNGFPHTATTLLDPSNIFEDTSPLADLDPTEVVRLYMSLREKPTDLKKSKCYLVDNSRQTIAQQPITLCMRGICRVDDEGKPVAEWKFLNRDVQDILTRIAGSCEKPMVAISRDLNQRGLNYPILKRIVADEELIEGAKCATKSEPPPPVHKSVGMKPSHERQQGAKRTPDTQESIDNFSSIRLHLAAEQPKWRSKQYPQKH